MTEELPCKYDDNNQSCINALLDKDGCSTYGINRAACLNLKTESCYWDFESNIPSCKSIVIGLKNCLSLPKQTNSKSCS